MSWEVVESVAERTLKGAGVNCSAKGAESC